MVIKLVPKLVVLEQALAVFRAKARELKFDKTAFSKEVVPKTEVLGQPQFKE